MLYRRNTTGCIAPDFLITSYYLHAPQDLLKGFVELMMSLMQTKRYNMCSGTVLYLSSVTHIRVLSTSDQFYNLQSTKQDITRQLETEFLCIVYKGVCIDQLVYSVVIYFIPDVSVATK